MDEEKEKNNKTAEETAEEHVSPAEVSENSEGTEAPTDEKNRKEPRLGWGFRILYMLGGLSLIVYLIAVLNENFANFMSRYFGAPIRAVLASISGIVPFSIAELIVILLIPAFIAIIIVANKYYSGTWRKILVFSGKILSVAVVLIIIYTLGFGTGYHTSTLDKRLGIDKQPVSTEELRDTARHLTELVNKEATNQTYGEDGFSKMPYSLSAMNNKLLVAYDGIYEKYEFIQPMNSRLKPVMLSELMSYTHITGVYSYFTGEANLNIAFPDYTLPFTAAHELAHQRGIAREDEANFVAFLVCSASEDSYIRYSAYLMMLEYVTNAYYTAVSGYKAYDFSDFRELMVADPTVSEALSAYEKANGVTLSKYAELKEAMTADAALSTAVKGCEKTAEALDFYNKRVVAVTDYNATLDMRKAQVVAEEHAFNEFFKKYEHNIIASVSGAVNDTYLKFQGTPGSASYGMVVDLAVAYYKSGK